MNRRINGQFDDQDDEYVVDVLRTISGFNTCWARERRNLTLKNAELWRRRYEADGLQARVKHASEY